jgi:hypothetical protein
MSTALQLTPKSVNYLQPNIVFQQLKQNYKEVILADDVSASETPRIYLDGSGRAQINGAVTIDAAAPTTNFKLCDLPAYLSPLNGDWHFPVSVLRAGAYVTNAVKVESGGYGIEGITVTTPGSYATIPTFAVEGSGNGAVITPIMKAVTIEVATAQSGGGSYAPGDTIPLAGGTFSTRAVGTVATTKVASATVAAAGSGGTDGTQTVTGTTGIGTKFQASVTVTGGEITAVLSITVGGSYATNPTSLTNEPVTGANLTGAQLSVKMGVYTIGATTAGSYSALPSDPVSQFSTSGSGTGATFNVLWGVLGGTVVNPGSGYDEDSTLDISGGGGAGGGVATLDLGDETSGSITLINQPNQNDIVHLDSVNFLVDSYGA